jgi:hypothetical protein
MRREWTVEKLLNEGLLGILARGLDGVPNGLGDLRSYLASIVEALGDEAEEQGDRTTALMSGARVDTLLDIEAAILRRAAEVPATSVDAVLAKLAVWDLVAEQDDAADTLENALVRSAIGDLRRLAMTEVDAAGTE